MESAFIWEINGIKSLQNNDVTIIVKILYLAERTN